MEEDGALKGSLEKDGGLKASLEQDGAASCSLRKPAFGQRSRLWPEKEPAFGQRSRLWPEGAGFFGQKPALWPESRLTPAYAGFPYTGTCKSRLTPAYAGFCSGRKRKPAYAGSAGFFGRHRKEPAKAGRSRLLQARKEPALAGKRSRLTPASAGFLFRWAPRKEAGSFWPKPASFWPEKKPAFGQESRLFSGRKGAGSRRLSPAPFRGAQRTSTSLRGRPFGPSPRSCTMSFLRAPRGARGAFSENTPTAPNGNG